MEYTKTRTRLPFQKPESHYPSSQFLAAQMDIGLKAAWGFQTDIAARLALLGISTECAGLCGRTRHAAFLDPYCGGCGEQSDRYDGWQCPGQAAAPWNATTAMYALALCIPSAATTLWRSSGSTPSVSPGIVTRVGSDG